MQFKDAKRQHHSLTADAEKRLLIRIAAKIPQPINSDHLTALGFLSMLAAGLTYAGARWNAYALFAVIGWLALNWFGDSLDGTLARVRNQQRPRYGFYVDHILDAFGMAALFVGLAASGYMSWIVMLFFLLAYFILCIEIYLATYTLEKFHLSFGAMGPTELRIILAVGNVTAFFRPMVHLVGREYKLFDVGGVVAAVGIVAITIYSAIRHTRELFRQESLSAFRRSTGEEPSAALSTGACAARGSRDSSQVGA
jgi:archaetidylinositol phosphate synthase